jgi:hypothetical protein
VRERHGRRWSAVEIAKRRVRLHHRESVTEDEMSRQNPSDCLLLCSMSRKPKKTLEALLVARRCRNLLSSSLTVGCKAPNTNTSRKNSHPAKGRQAQLPWPSKLHALDKGTASRPMTRNDWATASLPWPQQRSRTTRLQEKVDSQASSGETRATPPQ